MLDWPHLPFVHRATIGRGLARLVDRRMDIAVEDRPWGFRSTIAVDGVVQPGALDFRWPNRMVLHIPVPRRTIEIPEARDEKSVRTDAPTLRFRTSYYRRLKESAS